MATIERSVTVDVPVTTAYNPWTRFEQFPRFMEGVRQVEQIDDTRLRWKAEVGGREKEWEAEITEQIPDERVAWRSRDGAKNSGVVTFHRLSDNRTRMMLQLECEPITLRPVPSAGRPRPPPGPAGRPAAAPTR